MDQGSFSAIPPGKCRTLGTLCPPLKSILQEKHPNAGLVESIAPAKVYTYTPADILAFEQTLLGKEQHNWCGIPKSQLYAVCLKHVGGVGNLSYKMDRSQLATLLVVSVTLARPRMTVHLSA